MLSKQVFGAVLIKTQFGLIAGTHPQEKDTAAMQHVLKVIQYQYSQTNDEDRAKSVDEIVSICDEMIAKFEGFKLELAEEKKRLAEIAKPD